MSKARTKEEPKGQRRAVNLCLPADTIEKGRKLQAHLRRPSLSNLVEVLIEDAAGKKVAA